jgi:hypothetical protein
MATIHPAPVPEAGDADEAPPAGPDGGGAGGGDTNAFHVENSTETKEKDPGVGEGDDADEEKNEEKEDGEKKEVIFRPGTKRTKFKADEVNEGVTKVDCEGCRKLKMLPEGLPDTVTEIDLSGCDALHGTFRLNKHLIIFKLETSRKELAEVHEGVTKVDCNCCYDLATVPDSWPTSLTTLNLSQCFTLTKVPDRWPASLTMLTLYYCQSITTLPDEWPTSLRTLVLRSCRKLTTLPNRWPTTLTTIILTGCENITTVPDEWPTSASEIALRGCLKLSSLPRSLPDSVAMINTDECDALHGIFRLSKSLLVFKLEASRTELSADDIPNEVTRVDCSGCTKLTTLPERWPKSTTEIILRGSRDAAMILTTLPEHWPTSLKKIDLSYCKSITTLPKHWPPFLTTIDLEGCESITALPLISPAAAKAKAIADKAMHNDTVIPESLVGLRVTATNFKDVVYEGTFSSFDPSTGEHEIVFDNGVKQSWDIKGNDVRVVYPEPFVFEGSDAYFGELGVCVAVSVSGSFLRCDSLRPASQRPSFLTFHLPFVHALFFTCSFSRL